MINENINKFSNVICPKCHSKTYIKDKMLKCERNHSYDISSEGYINLLPPHKCGSIPGDNKEMVCARHLFLSKGYYLPLADALIDIMKTISPKILIDVGCGEGYYTNKIAESINAQVYGIDISKYALASAAKANKNVGYCVESLHSLMFNDGIADALMCCFCPIDENEFSRVLKKNGKLIIVQPGKNHLYGLKSILYKNPYENEIDNKSLDGFTLLRERQISFNIDINSSDDIWNLFTMTPYFWKTSKDDSEKLKNINKLSTPIEFIIKTYNRL